MAKPGKGSQSKGKRGENEVVALLKEVMQKVEASRGIDPQVALSTNLYRNLEQYAGDKSGDINIPVYGVEVKFQDTLKIPAWWKQTCEQAISVGKKPCLFYRQPRKQWRVVVNGILFDSFIKSYKTTGSLMYKPQQLQTRLEIKVDITVKDFLTYYGYAYDHFLWSVGQ